VNPFFDYYVYCRIVPEIYEGGVPMIVEHDFAFPEVVEDGVTGFRCNSSDEMSYRASELVFDEPFRKSRSSSAHAIACCATSPHRSIAGRHGIDTCASVEAV
jgi:hypothetical protein